MGGIFLLTGFLSCGVVIADAVLRKYPGAVRAWIGMTFGIMLMMWLPSLFAYALKFSVSAQICAILTAVVLAVLAQKFLPGERARGKFFGDMPAWLPMALVLPLLALSIYLQFTHTLRNVDGALHVGQSTYGDLSLHLGIATGLKGATYPAQYTLIQGVLLGYPFLMDALSSSMLMLGTDLAAAFVVPGSLMMGLVYFGFIYLAWELTHRKAAVVLAYLLMFLNGGLGFFYVLDQVFKDPSALLSVFTGFYQAPANMPEYNLRWVNVICDMMIPQRTLLAGWTMLIPALFLLVRALKENNRRYFIMLGIWAGAMPMIHTHSFLALALISAGAMIYSISHAPAETRKSVFLHFVIYAGIAAAPALVQLLTWAIPQTVGGGSLSFRFNWVNYDAQTGTLIDGYFWFWIKNVGIIYLAMVPAALSAKKTGRALALGALFIYIAAELIQFQPNEYDNNKLFYAAFMLMLPLVGNYLVEIWDRLQGVRGRALLAAVFLAVSLLSGALSLARETVSDYTLFTADEVAAAEYAAQSTEKESVFLTGNQHNNAVNALAGKQIVCGTGSYLYFHGISYLQQQSDAQTMLESPAQSAALFAQYGVDYVYISNTERYNYAVDETWFRENCQTVYENGSVAIYATET